MFLLRRNGRVVLLDHLSPSGQVVSPEGFCATKWLLLRVYASSSVQCYAELFGNIQVL